MPTERCVRADDVVDTTRALLVWEPRRIVPSYAVPLAEVEAGPGGEVAVAFWDERVDAILDGELRSRPEGAIASAPPMSSE